MGLPSDVPAQHANQPNNQANPPQGLLSRTQNNTPSPTTCLQLLPALLHAALLVAPTPDAMSIR